MVRIVSKKNYDESVVNLGHVDDTICKEMLGTKIEDGSCITKIRKNLKDPNHAELELVEYTPRPKNREISP